MTPLISVQDVSLSYGATPLFESLSLVIEEGARTILIGPNGAGKSTLFRLINGEMSPDEGQVSRRSGLRLATVTQRDNLHLDSTVEETLSNALGEDHPELHRRIARCLGELGIADPQTSIRSLSGGWRKRVSIGAALIQEPDLLLLDEPTNHLDIPSILWLEQLLQGLPYAVVCISHDRYFIEKLATKVIELDRAYPKGFLSSNGSYSDFIETRELFRSQRESYRSSLANKVRREVEWLRQGVKARGTKSKSRIDAAHSMIEELGAIKVRPDMAKIDISDSGRKTKEFVVIKHADLEVGGRLLAKDLTITITPGMRLGIAGANGTGKTSLIRLITGETPPNRGTVKVAHNLKIAYLDQMRTNADVSLPLKKVLCPEGDSLVVAGEEVHVASWGRKFLFTQQHLSTPFSSLSGGEQARALLANLLAQPVDMLVLDEPTNDLDIPTREVLEAALSEFTGAVVLVTHDRYMLDAVCTELVGFTGERSAGRFADFSQWHAALPALSATPLKSTQKGSATSRKDTSRDKPQGLTYGEKIELGAITKKISVAEAKFDEIQKEIAAYSTSKPPTWLSEKCAMLAEQEANVKALYDRWELLERKKSVGS